MITLNVLSVLMFVTTFAKNESITKDVDSTGCIFPEYPIEGWWSAKPFNIWDDPGSKAENNTILEISCNSEFKLNGSSQSICSNGKWSAEVGECLKICPPIIETYSTKVTCNGTSTDCTLPENGTIATFKCAPFYENRELERDPFRKCTDGNWNKKILFCSAVCGREPLLRNDTLNHFDPWHVLIYRSFFSEKILSCVGTLINEKTILTASKCLTSSVELDNVYLNGLIAAVGKMITKYENPDSNPEVQYSVVRDGFVPETFDFFEAILNIAIIIVSTPFKLTQRVYPACFDWSNKYKQEFSQTKMSAKVAAIVSHERNSTKIFEVEAYFECEESYINIDRKEEYCVRNVTLYHFHSCEKLIDQGAGLIKKNSINEKYYVIGVSSLSGGPKRSQGCNDKLFTNFITAYVYNGFISEKARLYSTIEKVQFQTSCGIKSTKAQELIVNGHITSKSEYPWQVAIYDTTRTKKNLICGGSLISQKIVLTAAHCVTNNAGEKQPKENYVIAVGKYYRNFNDPRDENDTQFSTINEIIVPTEYKGWEQHYLGDIAILITDILFNITKGIQPICLDWEAKYEDQILKPNKTGFVAGWGFTQENQNPSEELKDLAVPYIDIEQCRKDLPSDYKFFLTSDKLCSGFLGKGTSVCKGDSGGPLVFRNEDDNRYYLVGIVSLSPQSPTGGCHSNQYALYTQVSKYIQNFILKEAGIYLN